MIKQGYQKAIIRLFTIVVSHLKGKTLKHISTAYFIPFLHAYELITTREVEMSDFEPWILAKAIP